MTRPEAIKKFFNTDGYPPIGNSEILDLRKSSQEAFTEIGDLCLAALGEELTSVTVQDASKK